MAKPPQRLTKSRVQELLDLLVVELAHDGQKHHIVVVGGAAMALAYYPEERHREATTDVDASYGRMDLVNEAAARVADKEEGIPANWLNDACKNYIPEGVLDTLREISRCGNAVVSVAGPELMLALKVRAARVGRDEDDIEMLMQYLEISSLDEVRSLVRSVFDGEHEISSDAECMVTIVLNANR